MSSRADKAVVVTTVKDSHAASVNGITPADLIDRLIEVHGVESIEDLRGKNLPMSLRTLQRWKADGWPQPAQTALDLVTQAGLLRVPEGLASREPETSQQILRGLVDAVTELTRSHRAALADLQDVRTRLVRAEAALARSGDGPKKRRTRRSA